MNKATFCACLYNFIPEDVWIVLLFLLSFCLFFRGGGQEGARVGIGTDLRRTPSFLERKGGGALEAYETEAVSFSNLCQKFIH